MSDARFGLTAWVHGSDSAKVASPTLSPSKEAPGHSEHRDITGGAARAAVFGVSDGLMSNVSLILGVAGAHPSASLVRLAGLAGLVGGAFSMGLGEWISVRAQSELYHRELSIEARELELHPVGETRELAKVYEAKGLPPELAQQVAEVLMKDPAVALSVHAQEELGVALDSIASPWQAAISSFFAFSIGALIPLLAWFFTTGSLGVYWSVGLSAAATAVVGGALAYFTERPYLRTIVRQVGLSAVGAGFTYFVGHLVGYSVN